MLTVKRVIGVASLLAVTLLLLFIQYVFVKENRQPLQLTNNSDEWYYDNPSTLTYPHDRFKAALFTFVKNDTASLTKLRHTIRNIEDQFNKERGYPYIIFTDQELSHEYMELASSLTKATVRFEKVDNDFYGYHPETDQDRAAQTRADMSQIMFGDSEDYRFQSRFMAGTIYRHPIMQELNFGWRFEAGTEYICPIDQDLFQYMYENNKTLSFVIALYEYTETIPTLYETVLDFASQHNEWITSNQDPDSLWKFIQDPFTKSFNGCHLWNNFQISNLDFFKSEKYQQYWEYIDSSNGIFYERWGDPIIQSLGAVLFLTKKDIQFFDTVGYSVANSFTHCPTNYFKCACRPEQNFDFNGYSCLRFYF